MYINESNNELSQKRKQEMRARDYYVQKIYIYVYIYIKRKEHLSNLKK